MGLCAAEPWPLDGKGSQDCYKSKCGLRPLQTTRIIDCCLLNPDLTARAKDPAVCLASITQHADRRIIVEYGCDSTHAAVHVEQYTLCSIYFLIDPTEASLTSRQPRRCRCCCRCRCRCRGCCCHWQHKQPCLWGTLRSSAATWPACTRERQYSQTSI